MKGIMMIPKETTKKDRGQILAEIEALELENELLANKRINEALEADEYNDEAKLGKDFLATLNKKRQTQGAQEAVRFQMVASFADEKEKRRYVESTQPEIRRLVSGKTDE